MSNGSFEDMDAIYSAARQHNWSLTGVSDYPPQDPVVGQSGFFTRFRHFIHAAAKDSEHFAHVFAVIGDWGRGKSRLGHELIAQANDCSPGWFARNDGNRLEQMAMFDDESDRNQYLGLYIRYSQVASEYQNSENWFAFGMYQALLPIARNQYDGSIQGGIAEQAYDRLEPFGFQAEKLSEAMELSQGHTEEMLYEDPLLASRLMNQAYAYLNQFGVKYLLIVLDELETAAEAATYGLETDELKRLDGRAIKLMGQAIKEEDPRRKMPWLRYVALCSPAVGDELREIQSTARRFELQELENNAFSDVSDYVKMLQKDKRLPHRYPPGLVEAAYAMSGANFGWFNVLMANADQYLSDLKREGKTGKSLGNIFSALVRRSSRISDYVLDHKAIDGLQTEDQETLKAARDLLFGQLPLPLDKVAMEFRTLVNINNEYDEPVASLYRRVTWDLLDCERALREAKFVREQDAWNYPGAGEGLKLEALLDNLHTFAVHETASGKEKTLLIPTYKNEFRQLLQLIYDHSTCDYAADALWGHFIGAKTENIADDEATHIGPSVAMLMRLNLRYRSRQSTSLIFRQPEFSQAHDKAIKSRKDEKKAIRQDRLTGLMRLIDSNWGYDPLDAGFKDLAAITTPRGVGRGRKGGLLTCEALKLHPQGRAVFAWVDNTKELESLIVAVAADSMDNGRTPVIALTNSIALMDQYQRGAPPLETAKENMLLYQVNSSETDLLERIGLKRSEWKGFELNLEVFTTKFRGRLNNFRDFIHKAVNQWRRELSDMGLIAWPLKPGGRLGEMDHDFLLNAWMLLCIENPKLKAVRYLDSSHGIDPGRLRDILGKLAVPPKALTQGYEESERAPLFTTTDDHAEAVMPPFLAKIALDAMQREGFTWTYNRAMSSWFWGYTWLGAKPRDIFNEWITIAVRCKLLEPVQGTSSGKTQPAWRFISRAKLENAIDEADNWLNGGGDDCYPAIVQKLKGIYGEGRISDLFAPPLSASVGAMTSDAVDCLAKSKKDLAAIRQYEEIDLVRMKNLEEQTEIFKKSASHRCTLWDRAYYVYSKDSAKKIDTNFKTVNLEDDRQPLWRRIGQARQFADLVERTGKAIGKRAGELKAEMNNDVETDPPFPRNLFVLSIETVAHIMEGSLDGNDPKGDTAKKQHQEAGTLRHFLRKLEIDKATERLELLGREVGSDIHTGSTLGLKEIDGKIIGAYRKFKDDFKLQQDRLSDSKRKIELQQHVLTPMPTDYPYQNHLTDLGRIQKTVGFVEDAIEDLSDQALSLRNKFQPRARMGDFTAIEEAPETLLKEIKNRVASLLGELRTIDASITAYRRKLVNRANNERFELINILFRASGQKRQEPMTLPMIETMGALQSAAIKIEEREQTLMDQANSILSGAGINLDRWAEIISALNKNEDPALSSKEEEGLVSKGLLVRTYRIGGDNG